MTDITQDKDQITKKMFELQDQITDLRLQEQALKQQIKQTKLKNETILQSIKYRS